MSKILSQDEIDELLEIRKDVEHLTGEQENDIRLASLRKEERRVSLYNFRRPKLFAQDQIRVLNHVHEGFARGLSVYLSAQLRTIVDISLYAIDQVLYSEYVMSSAPPSALYVVDVKELDQEAVIEIDPRLGIFIVEKLFGGTGDFLENGREISRIEQRILSKVMSRAFTELEKAWHQVHPFTLEERNFETNAEFVQIIPGVEPTMVATFMVSIYDHTTLLNICYPYLLLERLLNTKGLKRWFSSMTSDVKPAVRKAFEKTIRKVDVDVRAQLGSATVTMQDMMNLAPGDVLVLDQRQNDAIDILVDDRLKFRAHPGKLKGRRALRISEVLLTNYWEESDES